MASWHHRVRADPDFLAQVQVKDGSDKRRWVDNHHTPSGVSASKRCDTELEA